MSKKFVFLTAALLAVILLSGCTGGSVRGNTWPGLSASNDVAYLADGGFLFAVSIKDGTELWRYPDRRGSKFLFYTTPYITSDGNVIVGSSGSDFSLVALDPTRINSETKTPAEAWSFPDAQNHWLAAPLEVEGRLFAPNADGNLYVFDLNDGQTTKQPIKVIDLTGDLWAQPITDGENLYVSSLDHSVFAIDIHTYEILWHQDLGSAIPSSPILASDGNLYVGSFASMLEKFNPATGSHESVEETTDWVWGTPAQVEKNLYFGDLSGNLYSYNIDGRAYTWNKTIKAEDGSTTAITATPLAVNDFLLVATESGAIYDVDMEGRFKESPWAKPGGKIYTSPVMAGDLVLVSPMTAEAYLYAYDLNGRQIWSFKPED